jgi:hypothetical protein
MSSRTLLLFAALTLGFGGCGALTFSKPGIGFLLGAAVGFGAARTGRSLVERSQLSGGLGSPPALRAPPNF